MPQTNKQYGHPDFYKLLDQMAELHSRKNHDYAGTSDPLKNLRACTRLELDPFIGVMVRLQDKWSRIEEFVKSKTLLVKNESVEDTLMDNAVYSLLAIILLREQNKNVELLGTPDTIDKVNDDYNALEIDEPEPEFKAGDKVKIKPRSNAASCIKNTCKKANYLGTYVGAENTKPYDHEIYVLDRNGYFYNDEIFPVEGN